MEWYPIPYLAPLQCSPQVDELHCRREVTQKALHWRPPQCFWLHWCRKAARYQARKRLGKASLPLEWQANWQEDQILEVHCGNHSPP